MEENRSFAAAIKTIFKIEFFLATLEIYLYFYLKDN